MTDLPISWYVGEAARERLHRALHELGVRIPNVPGDCHCNILTEVTLTALKPIGPAWWAVDHPGIGILVYDDEGQARDAAGTAGTLLTRDTPDKPWRPA